MMKNRAVWVALIVLAIAAVVMIFFVLPGRKGEMADTAAQISETAKNAASDAAEKADRVKEALTSPEVMEKVERLKADAEAAAKSLQGLFANGRMPSDEELAEARAKAEAALKAITDFQAPDGVEAAIGDVVAGMKEKASKALELVKSMPDDAQGAAQAVAGLKSFFGLPADEGSEAVAENGTAPAAVFPTFDVLRVEKNGSTVVAGRGEPGTRVELVDGDTVIATQEIDNTGDFAIVLDTPLAAGDHQLVLRTTDKDGKVTVSEEVATVSVPADANGELLAMVSKPGEPSRILAMPEAEATQTAEAAAPAENAESSEPASASAEAKTPDAAETAVAEVEKPEGEAKEPAPVEIRVTAVELEGDNIYVAGEALPGASLKVYADDKPVDDTTADTAGKFVAEGVVPLAVGNHIIRADVVEPDTGKVIIRASVPFNRPEGERVAVAANTAASEPAATTGPGGVAAAQLTQLREEVAKALVLLKGLFADGKTPAADAVAAARSATKIALNALASFKPGPDADPDTIAAASEASASAENALKILDGLDDDPAKLAAAIPSIEDAASTAIAPVTADAMTKDALKPQVSGTAETSAAEKTAETPAEKQSVEAEPQTIEQQPLEKDPNAVVIRRGDTLWQISRRLYGKGIRYTTIYLANQKQILNPNMINPGQVFKVPESMLEDDNKAEETNRKFQSN